MNNIPRGPIFQSCVLLQQVELFLKGGGGKWPQHNAQHSEEEKKGEHELNNSYDEGLEDLEVEEEVFERGYDSEPEYVPSESQKSQ